MWSVSYSQNKITLLQFPDLALSALRITNQLAVVLCACVQLVIVLLSITTDLATRHCVEFNWLALFVRNFSTFDELKHSRNESVIYRLE